MERHLMRVAKEDPRRYDRLMAPKTRCLAVDDHQVVRQGLEILFGDTDDLELVGTVGSGEDAVEMIKQNEPQIVLMDVRLPGMDGVSTIKRIHEEAPNVQFVVFSAYGDRRLVSDAIAAGARGYVMKGAPPDDLLRAIRTVAVNKPFVDPSLSPMLLMTDAGRAEAQLSEREREILQLLAKGYHTEEVARAIGLSTETVKSDTKRVIGKLQADTRTHAVAIALRQALIE
jgi:NarL family two-component system response regulator YdfI